MRDGSCLQELTKNLKIIPKCSNGKHYKLNVIKVNHANYGN